MGGELLNRNDLPTFAGFMLDFGWLEGVKFRFSSEVPSSSSESRSSSTLLTSTPLKLVFIMK